MCGNKCQAGALEEFMAIVGSMQHIMLKAAQVGCYAPHVSKYLASPCHSCPVPYADRGSASPKACCKRCSI